MKTLSKFGYVVGMLSLIATLFMSYLKLDGSIDITWWLVFSPIIAGFAFVGGAIIFFFMIWSLLNAAEDENLET